MENGLLVQQYQKIAFLFKFMNKIFNISTRKSSKEEVNCAKRSFY